MYVVYVAFSIYTDKSVSEIVNLCFKALAMAKIMGSMKGFKASYGWA